MRTIADILVDELPQDSAIWEQFARLIHADAMLETDVPGKRTFAVQARDNSMRPLFSEGETIFVNPDLPI